MNSGANSWSLGLGAPPGLFSSNICITFSKLDPFWKTSITNEGQLTVSSQHFSIGFSLTQKLVYPFYLIIIIVYSGVIHWSIMLAEHVDFFYIKDILTILCNHSSSALPLQTIFVNGHTYICTLCTPTYMFMCVGTLICVSNCSVVGFVKLKLNAYMLIIFSNATKFEKHMVKIYL